MASPSVSCAHSSEAIPCTHALVEFIEEGCTGVVPVQHVFGETFQVGTPVTVLWSNRKEYTAVFLYSGSKKQCQKEEEHILDDEAAIETSDYNEEDNESGDSVDEGKEDQDNESPDGGKENQDNESPDEGKENQDNAKNGNSKKRRRRLLTNKDDGQSNNKKRKKGDDKGNKKQGKGRNKKQGKGRNKKTNIEEDFIVRIGKAPMGTVSFNVSDTPLHDLQNKEDTLRKEMEPYCRQTIELYSSDEKNDEFYRCCAMIEEGFTITNKHIRIPVEPVEGDQQRSNDPPNHYTGGPKEIDLENKVNELKRMVQNNEQKRDTICNEIRDDVTKIADKLEETKKTLALILAKLVRPNALRDDGFAPPPTTPVNASTTPATTPVTASTTPVTTPVIASITPVTTPVPVSITPALTTPVTTSTTQALTPASTPVTVSITPATTPALTPVTASTTPASTPVTVSITPATTPVAASITPASTPVTVSITPVTTPVTASTTPPSTSVTGSVTLFALPADLTSPIHFEEVQSSGNAYFWRYLR